MQLPSSQPDQMKFSPTTCTDIFAAMIRKRKQRPTNSYPTKPTSSQIVIKPSSRSKDFLTSPSDHPSIKSSSSDQPTLVNHHQVINQLVNHLFNHILIQ